MNSVKLKFHYFNINIHRDSRMCVCAYKCLILILILLLAISKINVKASEQDSTPVSVFPEQEIHSTGAVSNENIIMQTDTSAIIDMAMQLGVSIKDSPYPNGENTYEQLKVPTQIIKTGGFYFIVDCYHNQVLYNHQMSTDAKDWKVLTRDVELPHSIASDGNVFLVTDTERNRILVFKWEFSKFRHVQTFAEIGKRPHYIDYDRESQSFFVWSSMTGEMYIFKTDLTGAVCLSQVRQLFELEDYYVRSFAIMGDKILFPSGTNSYMILADKNTLEVEERYPVTSEIAGMAYAIKIGSYYYMTIACDLKADQKKATIIRTTDLTSLSEGIYETVYAQITSAPNGIPYYIDFFDGAFYMTQHNTSKSVVKFQIQNDTIVNTKMMF